MVTLSIDTPAKSYDAVIIGSGWLRDSRSASRKVLVVERGDWFRPTQAGKNDYL